MAILPINSWRKSVYIAHLDSITKDSKGNQTKEYLTPTTYTINVQPLSDDARIEMFGANAKKMYRGLLLLGDTDIKEFDVAYLENATPTGETVIGQNANFIVRRVQKQNIATQIFFESIKGQ